MVVVEVALELPAATAVVVMVVREERLLVLVALTAIAAWQVRGARRVLHGIIFVLDYVFHPRHWLGIIVVRCS